MTADDRTAADRKFALDVLDRVMAPQLALGEALKVAAAVLSTVAARTALDVGALGPASAPSPGGSVDHGAGVVDPLSRSMFDGDPLGRSMFDSGTDMGPQAGWLVQAHNRVVGWLPFDKVEAVTIYDARRVAQDPNLDWARVIPVYADGSTSILHARDLL